MINIILYILYISTIRSHYLTNRLSTKLSQNIKSNVYVCLQVHDVISERADYIERHIGMIIFRSPTLLVVVKKC